MSGDLTTALDRPYAQQPETRTAAVARRVSREEQADLLLAMLGLDDADGPTVDGRPACPTCGRPRLVDKRGGYQPCRREECPGGAR